MNIKFYTIILSIFVLIGLIVSLLVYAIKSERKIKELEKEIQQITIEANNKLLEKQKILLAQNQQLQKKLNELQQKNRQEQEQIKKTLNNADLIEEKQVLLYNTI